MRRIIILLCVTFLATQVMAQTDKEVNLNEVVVNGARVVNKADGQQIFPTDKQKENSTTGYSLLGKLALPNIIIDETMHTIKSSGNMGDVQVRINDIIATKQDIMTVDMKAVKYVEYIRNPGVRYGQDVAFVINIVTKRAVSGYVIGTDITQTLTTALGDYNTYGRWNRGKNELGLDYTLNYHDFKGQRSSTVSNYLLEDNSIYTKTVNDTYDRDKNLCHNIRLRYNRADSDRYVIQVTLSGDFSHSPIERTEQKIITNNGTYTASREQPDRSSSPVLDIYSFSKLGSHQSFTANAVGTYISSDYSYFYDEMGKIYQYSVDGRTYSLTSEAIYENVLKPFTLSSGLQYQQKYLSNDYSGDTNATTTDRTSNLYVFTQIKGHLSKLSYVLGVGISKLYYRQGVSSYDYWLLRPKFTLSYPLLNVLKVKYDFGISQHPPRPEYLSNVLVRTDEMGINEGNPDLKPAHRTEHVFTISYQDKRMSSDIEVFYRRNAHPCMRDIKRTNDGFIFTYDNQKACNLLYIQNNTRYDLIPDKLTATLTGGLFRCFNYGNTYKHHYSAFNSSMQMMAYLGKFTLQAYADNGFRWLEGENKGHEGAAYYLTASYKIGNADISVYWQHCLQSNPKRMTSELLNRYVSTYYTLHNRDFGNMISLNFSWRLSHGRKYADINRKMNNTDKDTGIMK